MTEIELPTIAETIARAKQEIIEDVNAGYVPFDVKSFAQLHDFRDANYYGGAFESPWDEVDTCSDDFINYWNAVQNALDAWIKSGELARAVAEQTS